MEVIHGCEQDSSSTWADIAKILSLHIWEEQLQPLVLKQESSRLDDGRDPRVRAGLVLHLRGHHPPHWQAQTGHLSRWGCFNNICIINYCYLLQTLFSQETPTTSSIYVQNPKHLRCPRCLPSWRSCSPMPRRPLSRLNLNVILWTRWSWFNLNLI